MSPPKLVTRSATALALTNSMQNTNVLVRSQLSTQIGRFAGHVVFGTVGFIILAIPAITLSFLAHQFTNTFISPLIIDTLLYLHYFLFAVDTLVFVAYIVASIYTAGVELIRYVKGL